MKTPLYDSHVALGAKMVDFAGWEMPIQYKGIIHEHNAVRNSAGIFDVSHMGRITVEGEDAESLLNYLSTNQILNKENGSATYTVWCNNDGGSIDDLIVYKVSHDKFFIVVNASNRDKDLRHLQHYGYERKVIITPKYDEEGILALQGPKAIPLAAELFPEANKIPPMHFATVRFKGTPLILSRTGYTGSDGFELYAPKSLIKPLWDYFLSKGVEPIGLGARDTLRLEMGFALYGHELSDTISPIESVSAWTLKKKGHEFLGRTGIELLEKSPKRRYEYGVVLQDKGIAREGYTVFQDGHELGKVTSGTMSPSLNLPIAIVLVEKKLKEGDSVDIQIRQNLCRAQVVKLPFYRKEEK